MKSILDAAETNADPLKTRQHGEYRTRGLVLEAWDRMEACGDLNAMGM